MARSDLLLNLVRASSVGDKIVFRKTLEALIAEERQKQHHVLADRLAEYLSVNSNGNLNGSQVVDEKLGSLFFEVTPHRPLTDLILPEDVLMACTEIVEEQQRRDLLRSYNLEPRHRILLAGPPGNGKTSLAEALAFALMVPLVVVRYEGVIGSYLGETAVRLRRLFDYVRTRQCVLFFDEFDTLGKERGDVHETGEIKRVVSSLLLQMDDLPSHVIIVTATNHPELLDRAVWRRFQARWYMPLPEPEQIKQWVKRFEQRLGQPLGHSPEALAGKLKEMSFAELEDFGNDVLRRHTLALPAANVKEILSERLKQWQARFRPAPENRSKR
jgi:SpoVK/Ycf46/Vps4 family AAA+-type ATPase